MRLLHITPTYAPCVGGIEEVVFQLARQARKEGIDADVLHVAVGLQKSVRREDTFSVTTLPLIGHRMLGWVPGLSEIASSYDLLHVHDPQVGALTMNIGGSLASIPAVLSTHGGFGHTQKAAWAKRLHARFTAPRLLRRYSQVMASSQTDLAVFQQYAPNTVLVENGVDTQKYYCNQQVAPDPSRWIYWGRFSRNKRLDTLINLIASLARQNILINLAICGRDFDGILPDLHQQVATLGLERQVSFKIGLDTHALKEEAASRSVFVLPSEYEGFGLSILEAMGAGLVPLCRDVPPMNDLTGGTGHFLSFDGRSSDIQTIHNLVTNSVSADFALAQKLSRERAASFDWETRFSAYLREYRTCVEAHVTRQGREK
jgi:alpha-1,3-mannosyltransferase